MSRVEILGALCGASVNYGFVRGAGSGTMQGVELAGYLSGVDAVSMHFALAKYMGDEKSLIKLRGIVRTWVNGMAQNEGWFGEDFSPFRRMMADLPLDEVVSPGRCKCCNGVGFVVAKVCKRCHGTGHVLLSDNAIAERLGLHHQAFRRTWRDRYSRILSRVQALDSEVNRAVSRQVSSEMGLGF